MTAEDKNWYKKKFFKEFKEMDIKNKDIIKLWDAFDIIDNVAFDYNTDAKNILAVYYIIHFP